MTLKMTQATHWSLLALALAACDTQPADTDTDSGTVTDAGSDTASDTGTDTASDTGTDTASDTGTDTASDTGTDTASDTAVPETCSDGVQNQDETGVDCGGVCDPCQDCVPTAKRLFMTSQKYNGDLQEPTLAASGLAGAQALCQLHANNAGLGGTWDVWLSDSTSNAVDRLADVGPWYLVDRCTLVFPTLAELVSPLDLVSGPRTAFNHDEFGAEIHPANASFWSGTDRYGRYNGFSCSDWTNGSPVGAQGGIGSPYFHWDHPQYWTDYVTHTGNLTNQLLCVEQ